MDKDLKECLQRLDSKAQQAVCDGRVSGRPFVEFANHAGAVFHGFEVLFELIQTNQLKEDSGDGDALNQYESGSVMSMMRATCNVMGGRVEDLARWTSDRLKEKEGHRG